MIKNLQITNKTALFTLFILACGALFLPPSFSLIFGFLYVLGITYAVGKRYYHNTRMELSWILGFFTLIAYFVLVGSILFYTSHISTSFIRIMILISPLLLIGGQHRNFFEDVPSWPTISFSPVQLLRYVYLVISITGIAYVYLHQTVRSIVSPWQVLSPIVFSLFFVSALLLCALFILDRNTSWLYTIPLYFYAFAVSTIVFPLGFGFDPFVHKATESILFHTGTINPKPFYYIGYYILVEFFSVLLRKDVTLIDSYILPALASIIIPGTIFSTFRYMLHEKSLALLISIGFLFFPYQEFIQSTPQSLSFLWSLSLLFLSVIYIRSDSLSWIPLGIIGVTAFLFHPLTGLPLVIFAFGIFLFKKRRLYRTAYLTFIPILIILLIIAVPVALWIAGLLSSEFQATLFVHSIHPFSELLGSLHPFVRLDDLLYTFLNNFRLIILISALFGSILLYKMKEKIVLIPFIISALAVYFSYIILKGFFAFNFISYIEQSVFSTRLLTLSLYLLLPLAFYAFSFILKNSLKQRFVRVVIIILIPALMTASWYLSYPRFDTHYQHKGYTASIDDYQIVQWIHDQPHPKPYIVLANQTVSAVAIKQYGFSSYLNGLFYYPVPTNGELYRQFLNAMDAEISIESTLKETRTLTGAEDIYIVLNDYWSNVEELKIKYMSSASSSFQTSNRAVSAYLYHIR